MKTLTKYYKNGYDFVIKHREGNLAVACGISRQHGGENWEVIEIQSHNGMTMAGVYMGPSEFPPSNNQFGLKGWTVTSEKRALELFEEKVKAQEEKTND